MASRLLFTCPIFLVVFACADRPAVRATGAGAVVASSTAAPTPMAQPAVDAPDARCGLAGRTDIHREWPKAAAAELASKRRRSGPVEVNGRVEQITPGYDCGGSQLTCGDRLRPVEVVVTGDDSTRLGLRSDMLAVASELYDATITGPGSVRLPAITGDGTCTIATPAGEVPFGTFIVERGIVVHSTGAVAFGSGGLFFNAAKLATVSIPAALLTIPAGVGRYRLGVASLAFQGSTTFRLPDGTFTVTAADGTRPLGTFTVAQRTVVAATGAISPRFNGVAFDTARLRKLHGLSV